MEGISSFNPHEDPLRNLGPEDAYEELEERLRENPTDEKSLEQRRQLILRLKEMIQRLTDAAPDNLH